VIISYFFISFTVCPLPEGRNSVLLLQFSPNAAFKRVVNIQSLAALMDCSILMRRSRYSFLLISPLRYASSIACSVFICLRNVGPAQEANKKMIERTISDNFIPQNFPFPFGMSNNHFFFSFRRMPLSSGCWIKPPRNCPKPHRSPRHPRTWPDTPCLARKPS
jgi:hypothetical protein